MQTEDRTDLARKVDPYWAEQLRRPPRPRRHEADVHAQAWPHSLLGGSALGSSLTCWLLVLIAALTDDGDVMPDSTGVILGFLWLVAGLVTLVVGVWALAAPKGPRDRKLGLVGLGIFASQFLIAFAIAYAAA